MKSFKEYLKETPPPEDWDRNIFKGSFKGQIEYAKEKSKRIGTGSSRVAFIIPYEGRDTVIKIAKNRKGLAQNEKEADYGMYNIYPDILIPLIDYDEENDSPTWVHFEKADKLTPKKFQEITGFNFDNFTKMLKDAENECVR